MKYDGTDLLGTFVVTAIACFFIGCQFMQWLIVDPLEKEAIKRGYGSYTITDTNHRSTSQFTWK